MNYEAIGAQGINLGKIVMSCMPAMAGMSHGRGYAFLFPFLKGYKRVYRGIKKVCRTP